nr:MAG TPA: hypothetical protein [Caudoviricetes sp.]
MLPRSPNYSSSSQKNEKDVLKNNKKFALLLLYL